MISQHNKFSFARHETFHLRDGWLYKGLSALREDSSALHYENAHHKLGLGINMLKSLIYWLQATNLVKARREKGRLKPVLELTPLAELILEKDQYFEDIRTLWLLHIQLCTNRDRATFFYWSFNEFSQREFTESRLVKGASNFIDENEAKQVAESSLVKDARCLINSYVASDEQSSGTFNYDTIECPLASLGLIRKGALPGYYKFNIGEHRDLPPHLFLYALYNFRDISRPKEIILSLDDVKWAPYSPGRIFCLDMHSIIEYIEEIQHSTTYLNFTRTAELNMVSLEDSVDTDLLLKESLSDGVKV
jgi:hypothetical protein